MKKLFSALCIFASLFGAIWFGIRLLPKLTKKPTVLPLDENENNTF